MTLSMQLCTTGCGGFFRITRPQVREGAAEKRQLVRMRSCPRTRAYVARRTPRLLTEGHLRGNSVHFIGVPISSQPRTNGVYTDEYRNSTACIF